jgi:mannan endo-1,4-beta-mannosidase
VCAFCHPAPRCFRGRAPFWPTSPTLLAQPIERDPSHSTAVGDWARFWRPQPVTRLRVMPSARLPRRRALLGAGVAAAGGLMWPACGEPALRLPLDKAWIPERPPTPALPGGLGVTQARFVKAGRPFFMHGFNHWAAATLAREDIPGGWDGVRRDLDDLQAAGTNVVRVWCGGEGRNEDFPSLFPSLQPARGQFDPVGVAGLHRLVEELERRDLHAILVLTNFHPWSGGLPQYMAWAHRDVPAPGPSRWLTNYRLGPFTSRFFEIEAATVAFAEFVRFLVPQFRDHRAVIWELCNEARGFDSQTGPFQSWIARTAALVKSLAPAQLVTTGSPGNLGMGQGTSLVHDHESPDIDFVTFHIWPPFWDQDWFRMPGDPKDVEYAERNIRRHAESATKVAKPVVLEAFAYPRDGIGKEPGTPTRHRDRYFDHVYGVCHQLATDTTMAGVLPWAWGGSRRPPRPGEPWRLGDPLTGDATDEPQGRASIYRGDSTLGIIKTWAARPITGPGRIRT